MAYTKRTTAVAATDDSMALELRRSGSESQDAAIELIAPVAGEVINNLDPEIFKEPARVEVQAAIVESDLVSFNDEGIPKALERDGYVEVDESTDGRFLGGLTDAGVNHKPLFASRRIDLTGSPFGDPEARWEVSARPGYSRISIARAADGFERMAEDALDDQGKKPDWVLAREFARAGALGLIDGSGRKIRLLVVAGQSNATPRGATTQIDMGFKEAGVLYWDAAAGMIRDTHPVEWLGTGFARQWVKDHPSERVLIVNAASGSTGFRTTSLDPAPSGYVTATGTWNRNFTADTGQVDPHTFPNEYLITRVANAAAAALAMTGEEPQKLAMLWGQGESDINTSASYAAWQDDLFTWVRGQWGTPDLPIIVASMTPARISDTTLPNYANLDRVQQDTPSRLTRTAYSRGPSFMEENTELRTHYLPLGQEKRGREIAQRGMIRALQNKAAADPLVALHPPQSLAASRVGTKVKFAWEHPACRTTSITGEFSTNNGTSWTPITFPNLMPVEWETTTASPVLLRLASVNGADVSYKAEIGA